MWVKGCSLAVLAVVLVLAWAQGTAGQEEAPALKIEVKADSLLQLTGDDLAAAGFPLAGLNPRYLHLAVGGAEVAMFLACEDDGALDPGDYLLFYGQAATGPYTRRNVYWLTAGAVPGARMAVVDGTPSAAYPVPVWFPDSLHAEEDHVYWQNPPEGGAADHWFWSDRLRAPASTTVHLALGQVAPGGQATLRAGLRGRSDDPVNPDHHTRLTLNGAWLGETWWDGGRPFTHTVVFSATLLASGVNTLTLESVGDTGAAVDEVYLNWLEVDYRRGYTATDDTIYFSAPASGTYTFQVGGFSSDDVWLLDVSEPLTPALVIGAEVSGGRLRFSAAATPATRYLALTSSAWLDPAGLLLDTPSDLHSGSTGADEVIIAPTAFHTALEPLAARRRAEGLRVAVVDVQDVYDEFAHGLFHPPAIRDFLRYAYEHWPPPAPQFVLLVGDANLDYLDRLGSGAFNRVPTLLLDTWPVGEAPSDNGFVCLAGDDPLPEMALGRLPARTADEVAQAVTKIVAYETAPPPGAWRSRAVFVADDDSPSFESLSEGLIAALPPAYQPIRLYADGYAGDLAGDIAATIDAGALLVNYVGHGSVDNWGTWAGGRIWAEADVNALHNQALPFVTAATCLNGFFAHPLDSRSLAEAWLLAEGGAIAAWAPTATGDPAAHQLLFGALYQALFQDRVTRLGEATRQAEWAAYEQSPLLGALVETYVLFGDPATRLHVLDRPYRVCLPLVRR